MFCLENPMDPNQSTRLSEMARVSALLDELVRTLTLLEEFSLTREGYLSRMNVCCCIGGLLLMTVDYRFTCKINNGPFQKSPYELEKLLTITICGTKLPKIQIEI